MIELCINVSEILRDIFVSSGKTRVGGYTRISPFVISTSDAKLARQVINKLIVFNCISGTSNKHWILLLCKLSGSNIFLF